MFDDIDKLNTTVFAIILQIFESGLYLDFPWKTDYCFMGVLVILVSRIGVKDVMIACV